jgi:hypothetical protein
MVSTCGYATQLSRQFPFHTRQTRPIIEEAGTPAVSLVHLPALLGIMNGTMERTLERWKDDIVSFFLLCFITVGNITIKQ